MRGKIVPAGKCPLLWPSGGLHWSLHWSLGSGVWSGLALQSYEVCRECNRDVEMFLYFCKSGGDGYLWRHTCCMWVLGFGLWFMGGGWCVRCDATATSTATVGNQAIGAGNFICPCLDFFGFLNVYR